MTSLGSTMRAMIEGGPEGLEIVIPARRNLFALVFLGIWLVGWFMGEVTAMVAAASIGRRAADAFLLLWLLLWTVGGCFAAYSWIWMLVGKEHLLLGTSALRVKRDILGLGRTRSYELFKIRNLRVTDQHAANRPVVPRDRRGSLGPWGPGGGSIAFDYEGKTVKFGGSIDAAEARMIVERMKARFAFPEMPSVS